MRSWVRAGILLALVALWAEVARAQESLTKIDQQGPVTVTVTLAVPPVDVSPVRLTVLLDTHSVPLDGIQFAEAVAMRSLEGVDIMPSVVEDKGSGHHREAVLVFPPISQGGTLRIVVKNVGGIPERLFIWGCPTIC